MDRTDNLFALPDDVPAPVDDRACDHLPGAAVPPLALSSTAGRTVNLAHLPGRTVVYVYPMIGRPGEDLPVGWNETPGARGCTPQSCAFRDHAAEVAAAGARLFGLSTQDTERQREAVARLHLPYELLSDEGFGFVRTLSLPEIRVAERSYAQRVTLVLRDGAVEHVFYPVFPPDRNARDVVEWLRSRPES